MSTNITKTHRERFEALTGNGPETFALLSCFVHGEAAAAIAMPGRCGTGLPACTLFVSVTRKMALVGHHDVSAATLPLWDAAGCDTSFMGGDHG